jgi:hypothetical protein
MEMKEDRGTRTARFGKPVFKYGTEDGEIRKE